MPSLDDLLSQLKESEELLNFPSVGGHLERANALLISIARNAPSGEVADLAMRITSAANAMARGLQSREEAGISRLLWRLRLALEEAKRELLSPAWSRAVRRRNVGSVVGSGGLA